MLTLSQYMKIVNSSVLRPATEINHKHRNFSFHLGSFANIKFRLSTIKKYSSSLSDCLTFKTLHPTRPNIPETTFFFLNTKYESKKPIIVNQNFFRDDIRHPSWSLGTIEIPTNHKNLKFSKYLCWRNKINGCLINSDDITFDFRITAISIIDIVVNIFKFLNIYEKYGNSSSFILKSDNFISIFLSLYIWLLIYKYIVNIHLPLYKISADWSNRFYISNWKLVILGWAMPRIYIWRICE